MMGYCDDDEDPIKEPLEATARLVLNKPPCVRWLLQVIAALDPDHEVFSRSYVPPKVTRYDEIQIADMQVNDPNGFFTDIPVSLLKNRRSRAINYLPKTV